MNSQITAALLDAGWHEGRNIDVSDWMHRLEGGGFHLNDYAVGMWRSLGGLTVRSNAEREPPSSFHIDPWDACGDRVEEGEILRSRNGVSYSPLGTWSGQFRTYVGDDGRVIATQLGQEYLLGAGVAKALEFVVRGDPDGNRRPWVCEPEGDTLRATSEVDSHNLLLESAGLTVADPMWVGPVPSRSSVWRTLRSRYLRPLAVVPADGSSDSLITAQEAWREASAAVGLFGADGKFIISTTGVKLNGRQWSLVCIKENVRILEGLAFRDVPTEFVSMSVDGQVAAGLRVEGESLLVFATQFMIGDSLAIT
jgi:hypothetical protein